MVNLMVGIGLGCRLRVFGPIKVGSKEIPHPLNVYLNEFVLCVAYDNGGMVNDG